MPPKTTQKKSLDRKTIPLNTYKGESGTVDITQYMDKVVRTTVRSRPSPTSPQRRRISIPKNR